MLNGWFCVCVFVIEEQPHIKTINKKKTVGALAAREAHYLVIISRVHIESRE
jgi:hypothetical protein